VTFTFFVWGSNINLLIMKVKYVSSVSLCYVETEIPSFCTTKQGRRVVFIVEDHM